MRWKVKPKRVPYKYERRIIKKFAFLPIELMEEKRWLETVYIVQQYEPDGIFIFSPCVWINEQFVTKEDYIKYKSGSKQ